MENTRGDFIYIDRSDPKNRKMLAIKEIKKG